MPCFEAKHVSRFRWWCVLPGLSVVVVVHTVELVHTSVELVHASVGERVVLFFSSDQMPQDKQQELRSIKEWLAKEAYLPKDFDDFILEKFLHSCHGSLERTKKCIEKFCTTRAVMSEVYSSRDPNKESLKTALSITNVASYDAGDNEILIHQLDDPNLEKFQFYDILKSFGIQADMWIKTGKKLPEGHIIILDIKCYYLKIVPKINIFFFRDFLIYLLEGMPVRVKQIYAINSPPFYDTLFSLVKPVLPAEICNIIEFFPDHMSLHKYIDKKYLPVDYDGEAQSLNSQQSEWVSLIQSEREMFLNDNLWKADQTKKPKTDYVENSMNGSFKSLSID